MISAPEIFKPIAIKETLREIKKRTPEVRVARFITRVLLAFGTQVSPPPPEVDGGAGHPVREERPGAGLRMDWAACELPLHGEDAHFGHGEAGFVGVADGVGSYRDRGVDAGAFARELMGSALRTVDLTAKVGLRIHPKEVLKMAYYRTAVTKCTPGASTAVILSLRRAALWWAYIGDSGFAVLRGGRIVHRSVAQQRRFNCPYQLSSKGSGRDKLKKAMVGRTLVRDGDVVVVGTDGLFDNMDDFQLECAVRMGTELGFSPKNMADIIAAIAHGISKNKRALSPFCLASVKAYGVGWSGGKEDDITVIVAYIVAKDS
jgi:protein phosphatase PTC7